MDTDPVLGIVAITIEELAEDTITAKPLPLLLDALILFVLLEFILVVLLTVWDVKDALRL
jgi:hypothetical protein